MYRSFTFVTACDKIINISINDAGSIFLSIGDKSCDETEHLTEASLSMLINYFNDTANVLRMIMAENELKKETEND